jgi:hypothetical protein
MYTKYSVGYIFIWTDSSCSGEFNKPDYVTLTERTTYFSNCICTHLVGKNVWYLDLHIYVDLTTLKNNLLF